MSGGITKRIDAVTHIPESHRSVTPPAPRSIKIELTARCNYRCRYCAVATRPSGSEFVIAWPLFERIARDVRAAGVEEIGLFYLGESFLVPELLIRAIRFLKQEIQIPYVFLTSNGSLANGEIVDECMLAGLDSLKWSVNAGSLEQFRTVTGVKSATVFARTFEHIAEAARVRKRGGYQTRLYASSIRYDGADGAAMEALLDEKVRPFVDEHYWLPLYSMGSLAAPSEAQINLTPTVGNRGRAGAEVPPVPCWACFSEAHVLSDGRLSACCFDAKGDWIMGDLTMQSFMEAWHSPKFQALRAAHLAGDVSGTVCAQCQACGV